MARSHLSQSTALCQHPIGGCRDCKHPHVKSDQTFAFQLVASQAGDDGVVELARVRSYQGTSIRRQPRRGRVEVKTSIRHLHA